MTAYIARRVLHLIPVLVLVASLVFFVFRVIPGDLAVVRLGENADPDAVRELRRSLGTDRPVLVQFWEWISGAAQGDLGKSYINEQPVASLVLEKLVVTLEIALLGTLLALVISVPVAIIAALRRGSWIDHGSRVLAMIGFCMPRYWLALLLILLFSVNLGWFPVAGYVSLAEDPLEHLRHAALPVVSIGLTLAAVQMRFLRSSLLDVLGQDYVRTAYSKGLRTHTVVWRHALKNALMPFVTVVGLELGGLLGGLVVVEQIFSWPGVGWLIVQSITHRDYAVVQGAVLVIATAFVLINLAVDLLYARLDPRIAYERGNR